MTTRPNAAGSPASRCCSARSRACSPSSPSTSSTTPTRACRWSRPTRSRRSCPTPRASARPATCGWPACSSDACTTARRDAAPTAARARCSSSASTRTSSRCPPTPRCACGRCRRSAAATSSCCPASSHEPLRGDLADLAERAEDRLAARLARGLRRSDARRPRRATSAATATGSSAAARDLNAVIAEAPDAFERLEGAMRGSPLPVRSGVHRRASRAWRPRSRRPPRSRPGSSAGSTARSARSRRSRATSRRRPPRPRPRSRPASRASRRSAAGARDDQAVRGDAARPARGARRGRRHRRRGDRLARGVPGARAAVAAARPTRAGASAFAPQPRVLPSLARWRRLPRARADGRRPGAQPVGLQLRRRAAAQPAQRAERRTGTGNFLGAGRCSSTRARRRGRPAAAPADGPARGQPPALHAHARTGQGDAPSARRATRATRSAARRSAGAPGRQRPPPSDAGGETAVSSGAAAGAPRRTRPLSGCSSLLALLAFVLYAFARPDPFARPVRGQGRPDLGRAACARFHPGPRRGRRGRPGDRRRELPRHALSLRHDRARRRRAAVHADAR